jgi:hypothetical protein
MKQRIDGHITRADGEHVQFCITDAGYSQWGVAQSTLGQTSDLLQAVSDAATYGTEFFNEPGPELRPQISHEEAQELHMLVGGPVAVALDAGMTSGSILVPLAELMRAREIAALVVTDTDPSTTPEDEAPYASAEAYAAAHPDPWAAPMGAQLDELRESVRVAREAAEGDSNDGEIEALQSALDEALGLLGITDEA